MKIILDCFHIICEYCHWKTFVALRSTSKAIRNLMKTKKCHSPVKIMPYRGKIPKYMSVVAFDRNISNIHKISDDILDKEKLIYSNTSCVPIKIKIFKDTTKVTPPLEYERFIEKKLISMIVSQNVPMDEFFNNNIDEILDLIKNCHHEFKNVLKAIKYCEYIVERSYLISLILSGDQTPREAFKNMMFTDLEKFLQKKQCHLAGFLRIM